MSGGPARRSPGGAGEVLGEASNGGLARATLPSGQTLTYGYNAAGRKIWATETSDAQPAGVTTTYEYDELGHLTAQTGPKVTDAVTADTHQTKTTVTFDPDGRPTGTTTADIAGNDGSRTATTTYDTAGRPDSDTDAMGGVTHYGYDALGRRTTVTDPLGQVTRYTYTPRSQPATTVVEGWNGDGKGTRDLTAESRAYDPAGRLASVTDAMGAVTSYTYFDDGLPATTRAEAVTQPDGTSHPVVLEANEYDGAGYLTKQTTGGGSTIVVRTVDPSGRVTQSVLDPAGLARTTTLGYDADDRVTTTTLKVSSTENSVQTDTYDTAGRLTRTQLASSTGGPTAVSTFTYDQRGLPTSSTTPNGNATGADPAAYTTTYQYDTLGRRTTAIAPAVAAESGGVAATTVHPTATTGYNAFGEAVTTKDALGRITRTTVDQLGRATEIRLPDYTPPGSTTPLTATSRLEYDKLSRITTSTDPAGRRTTFTYDRLGHQIQRIDPNSLGGLQPPVDDNPPTWNATWTPTGLQLSATDPLGARTEATYDQLGRTLTATAVERQPTLQNLTTKFTWDDAGNRTALTTPVGNTSTATYNPAGQVVTTTDALGRTSKAEYDGIGRTTRAIAPLGESVRTHYDSLGNPTATDDLDPAGTVLRTTTATYDLEGRPLTTTSPATGAVTSTAYDALGRAVKLTEPVASGQAITTTFGYDAAGNRTRLTDGRANTTVYTFNAWNLPESTIEPATTAHPAAADRTWTTAYDVAGQAVLTTEPGGVVRTSSYDPLGRLVRESGTGAEAATTDRELAYDKAGHLIRHNSATLNGQNYAYNDRGLLIKAGTDLTAATQTWEYDADGRVIKRWDKDTDLTMLGYKADGQLDWANNPKLKTQNWYGYDGDGRLGSQSYVAADPADATKLKPMSERRLSYDALGRLSGDQLLVSGNPNTPLTGTAYEYDLDNRLTRKTVSGAATDPVKDNRYGYDQAGRLTSWTLDGTTTTYEWDAAGNRTRNGTATATYDERNRLQSDGTSTYRYTARGTLTAVTTAGKDDTLADDAFDRLITEGTTTYTYDGLDRATTRGAARFTYDGGSNNLTGDGTWTYARDTAGNLLGAASATTSVRVRTDQHTDATATLDTNGTTVTGTTTYDPFGKPTTSGTTTSLGYQSGWTDPTTGDVNMHARWYRPGTGSFTNRDSSLLAPSPSVQANRYTYGNASPLNGTDPSGHFDVSSCGCAGGPAIVAPGGGGGISFGNGGGKFSGSITIPRPAPKPAAPNANTQAEPYVGEVSGYQAPSSSSGVTMPGFAVGGVTGLGYGAYGGYGYVPGNYAGSDIYQEKLEARDHWRSSSSSSSSSSSPTGTPVGGPEGTPDRGSDPRPTRPTCKTCRGAKTPPRPPAPRAEPPKPLWDPTKATVERPAPQLDWAPRDPRDTLNVIAASYSSASLLAMVALTPNVIPTTVAAPGPQPGQGNAPDPDKPKSCLERKPAGADTDNQDGSGSGWIMYGDMEDVEGSPGVKRPTMAEACLVGKPYGDRGTEAKGNITGWAEAKATAAAAGWKVGAGEKDVNLLARCHFIAREVGGLGKPENLAPCFQSGVNTTRYGMRDFEQNVVGKALKDNMVVNYMVDPIYNSPSSKIPMGFFMIAVGETPDGRRIPLGTKTVSNEKKNPVTGQPVQLGD
ncbi:RHS repeat-associated core domain-containing protein [Kitasatospora sp. NPDC001660]